MDKVEDFKAAITAGRKPKDLVLELSLANARELAAAESTLKNVARIVLRGAAKIHVVVDAAASSIERDGIACISKLEHTLFDDMNGTIRSTTGWGWSGATPPPRQTRRQIDCAA